MSAFARELGVTPEALEHEAMTLDTAELATWLQAHLGQQMTGYLAGLRDAKMVGRWASGKVQPRDNAVWRMQYAYRAARLLVAAYGDSTARSWLFGTSSLLDDRAPAEVLRAGRNPEDWRLVVPAAISFVGSAR